MIQRGTNPVRLWGRCWELYPTQTQHVAQLIVLVSLHLVDGVPLLSPSASQRVQAATFFLLLLPFPFHLPPRTHCCDGGRLLSRFRRHTPMPHIIRIADWCFSSDLPYLQHCEEAHVIVDVDVDVAVPMHACKLPSTLRRLAVSVDDYRKLKAHQATALQPRLLPWQLQPLVIERSLHCPTSHCRHLSPAGPVIAARR